MQVSVESVSVQNHIFESESVSDGRHLYDLRFFSRSLAPAWERLSYGLCPDILLEDDGTGRSYGFPVIEKNRGVTFM
jgi:hypothetical protein